MNLKRFVFNPFSENTYVIWDDTLECLIVDAGCYEENEENELEDFIINMNLKPVGLILTHCHLDHMAGNQFVYDRWSLLPEINEVELDILKGAPQYGAVFGVPVKPSPLPVKYLKAGDLYKFGNTILEMISCPGHSPGSLAFYHENSKTLISGDALFRGSIGRTDLPGGNHELLLESIRKNLFTLPDETIVYPGHDSDTTISREKRTNPFFQ